MYDYKFRKENNKVILEVSIPPRRREPYIIVDLQEIKALFHNNDMIFNEYDAVSGRVITNDYPPYETTWVFTKKKPTKKKNNKKKLDITKENVVLYNSTGSSNQS